MGSVPMPSDVAGGQSWLVGKSPSTGDAPGVQVSPSFGPPSQVFVVGLQIGQGWMNVRQRAPAPGQSAAVDRKSTRLKLQSQFHLVCRLLLEKKKHRQDNEHINQPHNARIHSVDRK